MLWAAKQHRRYECRTGGARHLVAAACDLLLPDGPAIVNRIIRQLRYVIR
jgi:hypothetical protein